MYTDSNCLIKAACTGNAGGGSHEHNYSAEWSYDSEYHWHVCTNASCDAPEADKAAHSDADDDRVCDVCNAALPSEGLEIEINDYYEIAYVAGRGTCTDEEIVIPSSYEGYPVASIGLDYDQDITPFAYDTDLKEIIIPSSITTIAYSFQGCSGLTELTFSPELEVIEYSFTDCTGLTEINFSTGLKTLRYSFGGCEALTEVVLPDSLTEIGENVFDSCSNLTSVTLPANLTSLGVSAFQYCWNLSAGTNAYTLYENGYYLGSAANPYLAFIDVADTSALSGSSIAVHEDTKIVGSYAFDNCRNYEVYLGNSLVFFGRYAFYAGGLYIHYAGTIAEWNEISKMDYMFLGMGADSYSIMCTDGSPEHD